MATALQNGDILSCRAWNTLGDQAAVNTYVYSIFAVTGGAVTDQDLCDAIDFLMADFYKGYQSTHSTYDGIQTYFVKRSGPLPAPVSKTTSAGAGTVTGVPAPPNTAPIFKYNTFVRGPSGRGRVYLPFPEGGNVAADGRTTNAFDIYLNSQATLMLAPLILSNGGSSATAVWSLLHRNPPAGPVTADQITQALSASKFGQMHKRGSYGRQNESPI